jgi:hypothetical protein
MIRAGDRRYASHEQVALPPDPWQTLRADRRFNVRVVSDVNHVS